MLFSHCPSYPDLLFMTAENEEGTCYIETMNLDGETNLKVWGECERGCK